MKPILETRRLRLRELTMADLDFVAEMLAHPEVMRYYPKLYSRAEAEEWVNRQLGRYARDGHGLWLVLDRDDGHPVGQVGLAIQEVDGGHEHEIGYLIHFPYWRRGYATEAAVGVRDYAFHALNRVRVISLIRPENTPSQGVARKLGMTPERETMFRNFKHMVWAVKNLSSALSTPCETPPRCPS